jgi:DNA invertase Pin-like site-specific DNA recombinase
MKKVALYIRISTINQKGHGDLSQEHALKEYCKNHGLIDLEIYQDISSGATKKRPQLEKLQKDIFMGRIGTVICWQLDRLSRDLRDGINILADWLEKDVRVIAVNQQFDFSGVIGKFIASILFGLAEIERKNNSDRIKLGMAAAKQRGVKIGGREPKLFKEDIERLKAEGLNMAEIAKRLGCSRQALYLVLKRNNKIRSKK